MEDISIYPLKTTVKTESSSKQTERLTPKTKKSMPNPIPFMPRVNARDREEYAGKQINDGQQEHRIQKGE
jgi:hypothetical protein